MSIDLSTSGVSAPLIAEGESTPLNVEGEGTKAFVVAIGDAEKMQRLSDPFARRDSLAHSPGQNKSRSSSADSGSRSERAPGNSLGGDHTTDVMRGSATLTAQQIQEALPSIDLTDDNLVFGKEDDEEVRTPASDRAPRGSASGPSPAPGPYTKRKRPDAPAEGGSPNQQPHKRREAPEVYMLREALGAVCRLVEELGTQIDKNTKREIKGLTANLTKQTNTLKKERIKQFLIRHQYVTEDEKKKVTETTKYQNKNSCDMEYVKKENEILRKEIEELKSKGAESSEQNRKQITEVMSEISNIKENSEDTRGF
ncbi:hypothetical protein ABEB36_015696 [Hypothenemus hampei]|uniref:Uncharacterized protein n=1 Tax=Hypothenemus hampei TaxID=57062 RepID=A0ABD1E0Z1_HYPHA